jgi:glycosyltransferase involved in cell wall biosynthesis
LIDVFFEEMRIVYCIIDSSRSGGMERSICCKANYLADVAGYEVTIITTDRKGKPNFYDYSSAIQFIDLDINYNESDSLSFFWRIRAQIKKRELHKERLTTTLFDISPDICISTYTHELSILSQIKDGSKKIAEIHFCRPYKKIQYELKSKFSLHRIFALAAEKRKRKFIHNYDAFVVLTKEDRERWKGITKIECIPNPLPFYTDRVNNDSSKQIISVGRLAYEKGYPMLIGAWAKIAHKYPDWKLAIVGEGEDKPLLQRLIFQKDLMGSVSIHPPQEHIKEVYLDSSFYVMSSFYEGFGLVLTEAMACGLPCVSFDCPSGPAEIIKHGEDGLLIATKDIAKLAEAMSLLIEDKEMRLEMSENAKINVKRFLPERIMPRWIALFEKITNTSNY